ncbi:uncharacterized protein LOC113147177 [Cyclospora cayetanensis]|uniref:Uncharacterized protein LOC113147177 n=1 Tax=Cyclospora cayetanensis TaxID=88456 RepID=A0A6P6RXM6_9EIME|nr:uncharacterized protein LOC113147177 [Cyclospora cayetanensis]
MRRIAEEDRALQHEQNERSRSIVQQILQEEWAVTQRDCVEAPAAKSRPVNRTKESAPFTTDKIQYANVDSNTFFFALSPSLSNAGQKNSEAFKRFHSSGASPCRARREAPAPEKLCCDLPSTAESPEAATACPRYPPLAMRNLTVFEQKKIQRALEEQQRVLIEGTPQRIAGRLHSGPSFCCTPSKVTFKAFESGRVYSRNVLVTNVSLGFSTFRVLPLPEELDGIISVALEAPGKIPAGGSTQMTITFTPKRTEDLEAEILLLSPTGPQALPVVCCRKRAVLTFLPQQQSPQALLKSLQLKGAPAQAGRGAISDCNIKKKSTVTNVAPWGDPGSQDFKQCAGSEERKATDSVIYLHAGDVQLGDMVTVHLKLGNTGSLSAAYQLLLISPRNQQGSSPADNPQAGQQNEVPNNTTATTYEAGKNCLANSTATREVSKAVASEIALTLNLNRAHNALHAQKDRMSLNIEGWREALQDGAVVLAQWLNTSDHHNSLLWKRIMSSGLDGLLQRSACQSSQRETCTTEPFQLCLKRTLVKNAAGEVAPLQTQDIAIIHAPDRIGRFVGFFSLQFLDQEHPDVVVVVDGQCVLPLVCTNPPLHDLGICVPDRMYRQQLKVTSNSVTPRTLKVESPEAEKGVLWVDPACSVIQPKGVTSLAVHLCFSFSFFQKHPEYVQPLPPDIAKLQPACTAFQIPIRIKVSEQTLCAETAITGILTETQLRLSRTRLHFGSTNNITGSKQMLQIHNPSLLIASYSFTSSHQALRIVELPRISEIDERVEEVPVQGSIQQTNTPSVSLNTVDLREGDSKACEDLLQYLPLLDIGAAGVLLPGETRTFAAVFNPGDLRCDAHTVQLAGGKSLEHSGTVRMKVLLADQAVYEVKIPWNVILTESPITVLPAPSLKLPTTPPGLSSSATLELKIVASQFSFMEGEIGSKPGHFLSPTAPEKHAVQFAGVLVHVQQPPSTLSALSISPLRLLLHSKKRCASLVIHFSPTEQYMHLKQLLQLTPPAEECIRGSSKKLPFLEDSEATKILRDKRGGCSRTGHTQSVAANGSTKDSEGLKKSSKVECGSAADSKTFPDKSPMHKDPNPKLSKSSLKSVGGTASDEGINERPFADESSKFTNKEAPATISTDQERFMSSDPPTTAFATTDTSVTSILRKMTQAGGARWTSLEENNENDFFAFDNPQAYHHAHWLIPLRICRLTSSQVDGILSGGELDTSQCPVSTCTSPPLVAASPKRVEFGSAMIGQRVYQHEFSAELVLQSERTRIAIPLSGMGLQHTVELIPSRNAYDMGALVCPQIKEGWLRGDFELTFATSGQAPRVLTFFGLATSSSLYATLPFLANGSTRPPLESGACSPQEKEMSGSICGCNNVATGVTAPGGLQNTDFCVSCYMESLPRLAAERGFLSNDEQIAPSNHPVAEDANSIFRVKGSIQSQQQPQLSDICLRSHERPFGPKTIDIRFGALQPSRLTRALPGMSPAGTSTDNIGPKGDPPMAECSQSQTSHSPPFTVREEKQKADANFVLQDIDTMFDDKCTKAIVVGGAWPPGRQGLSPFATVKGEATGGFEITIDCSPYSHMFSFEPTNGTFFPGGRQVVRAVFSQTVSTPAEDRVRKLLSHVPPEIQKQQYITATARLWLRGTTVSAPVQAQEVAIIRLRAPLCSKLG